MLTASHNPGGPEHDFGIKFNIDNGGPAPEPVTNQIHQETLSIAEYHIFDIPTVSLEQIGTVTVGNNMAVQVVNSVDDWCELMKTIFDFEAIREYCKRDFKMLFDGMHGVTGPYAKKVFIQELGMSEESLMNCVPKTDFGGGHPDPNLTCTLNLF